MVNKKQKNKLQSKPLSKSAKLRLVVERGEDRRQEDNEPLMDQRISVRRQEDVDKNKQELELLRQENERLLERQRKLIVSKPELILFYAALLLGVNVIFGWMAYLALFI